MYSDRTISVQKITDYLARYGGTQADALRADVRKWVGIPLYVHSRCVDPMFSISNRLSYGDAMLRITKDPPEKLAEDFCYPSSQWINVRGKEETPKNHFVPAQGAKILALLEAAFAANAKKPDSLRESGPDLFIITPFHTAAEGMRQLISNSLNESHPALASRRETVENWLTDDQNPHIGTVHTFQGREANEVIFMLGCDEGSVRSANWVSRNIVNVAVSRARYRLYVVGDAAVWSGCGPVMEMKYDLDSWVFDRLARISRNGPDQETVPVLPSCEVFETGAGPDDTAEEAGVDPGRVLDNIRMYTPFFGEDLTEDQYRLFGIASGEQFRQEFSPGIRRMLLTAFHIYLAMKPMESRMSESYDASFVGICFCKALEQRLKETFLRGFKILVPDALAGGKRIASLDGDSLTIGAFSDVAAAKAEALESSLACLGFRSMDKGWWAAWRDRVQACRINRNRCCHPGTRYSWNQLEELLKLMFSDSEIPKKGLFGRPRVMRGLMFETDFRQAVDLSFPEGYTPPVPEDKNTDLVTEYTLSPTCIRVCPADGEKLVFETVSVRRRDGTLRKLNMQRCARCGKYYISAPSLSQTVRLEEYDLIRR